MSGWRETLAEAVAASSIAEVARRLGISRTSISLLLKGRYPGGTERMEKRIMAEFGRICPVYGGKTSRSACAERKMAAMPTSNPYALRRWRECQKCGGDKC